LMEEKIRESEETFRTISSSAQDAIIMIDDKGNVSFWNEAAERIFGYTREEIEGRDLHKIVVPQRYHEAHKKGFNNFHKSGTGNAIGKIMELSALRKNGEEFPVDLSLSSVKVKGKWNSIGIVRDISDRKHQEDLQKAYQRVRESIWKMIKSEDIDTVAVTFRDALKDIGIQFKYFGINIIETSGKTPQVYAYEYSEKERNISKPGLDNVRVLMKIWKDGVPVYRKDIQKNDELGEKKDIESNFGNTTIRSILDVPFSHGTVAINSTKPDAFSKVDIESLVDMAQVLSEGFKRLEDLQNIEQYTKNLERMVEERTKDLNRALQDTEHARDNIDNILKAVADGLIVTDKYNRVVLMNKVAEDMLNIRLSEVINRPIDFAIEEKTLREKLINTFNKKKTNYQFDFRLQGNDPKHPVILRARTSIIYDKYGEKNGIVTSFTDVTHEREVDRMKTEFISTAAHELRTPLTSIVGFSKILVTRNDITEEERNRFLNYINNQGLKLSRIVSDILDISRIESGKGFELNLEPCNLGKIIEQVLPYYQELSSIHTFDLTIPEEPVILKLDSEKIEQVLKNILSNAVKYSPDGGIIHVSLQLADSTCKVSIKDEGIGMTAEQIAKVFDKFYRVNATNSAPDGTGLGMVIVKYIVEAHGGKIHVDSEYGVGTTVSFTLPANRKNTQKNRNVKD